MYVEQAKIHFYSLFYQFIQEITLIEHLSSNLTQIRLDWKTQQNKIQHFVTTVVIFHT
jgi:hypothetical protein